MARIARVQKILTECKDRSGYYIVLDAGWQYNGGHLIRERTQKEAYAVLRISEPCNCDECQGALR